MTQVNNGGFRLAGLTGAGRAAAAGNTTAAPTSTTAAGTAGMGSDTLVSGTSSVSAVSGNAASAVKGCEVRLGAAWQFAASA